MSINSIFAGSTPNSRDAIRQQYLNNLTLDIANMTKNLNANKLFKANGSTGSEPADTRSATEKYADIDNLRVQVRAGLKEITDGVEAERIVADISVPELQFLAGHLPFIVSDLKPKWKLGVPAGSFLPYFRKLMRKNIETEGIEYGLSQPSGGGVATTAINFTSKNDYEELGEDLKNLSGTPRDKINSEALMERFEELAKLTPSPEDRALVARLNDPDILDDYDNRVSDISIFIPPPSSFERALRQQPLSAVNVALGKLLEGINFEDMKELKRMIEEIRLHIGELENKQFEEHVGMAFEDKPISAPFQDFSQSDPYSEELSELTPLGGTTLRTEPVKDLFQAETAGTMLPSAYVNTPNDAETFRSYSKRVAEISPDEFESQTYDDKVELLRTYADMGKFNNMGATFLHMINALLEGHDVPEHDMDNEYDRFYHIQSLMNQQRGANLQQQEKKDNLGERIENFQMGEEDVNRGPSRYVPPVPNRSPPGRPISIPTREEGENFQMGQEDINQNYPIKKLIRELLEQGAFDFMPDFKETAEEIDATRPEDLDPHLLVGFYDAFKRQQQANEQEGLGAEEFEFPEFSVPTRKPPSIPVATPSKGEEEEIVIEVPKKKKNKSPVPPPIKAFEPIDLENFKQLTRQQKKVILQDLPDKEKLPPLILKKFNEIGSTIPQDKTSDDLYQKYLFYAHPPKVVITKNILPSSLPTGKSEAEEKEKETEGEKSTQGQKFSSPGQSNISVATEEQGKAIEKKIPEIHLPRTKGEFQSMPIREQTAVLDKAFGLGLFDDDTLDFDKSQEYINYERDTQLRSLTKSKAQEMYEFVLPIIKEMKKGGVGGFGLPKGRPKKSKNIIFGMGLSSVVSQPKVRVEGKNIDFSKGISAEPAYVPFGTHLLNRHRLKDNIVMMRTKKGGAIVNIPTQKVSGKLAKVLHIISGGGIPQFESVMDLTEGDKSLLHQISKTSKVSDRLSVPNPNKSKMEEEDNRFNILRGEVAIGNDNPAVIKEFKVLLLKFMREGRVPTGQGKAIMEELLLLGY